MEADRNRLEVLSPQECLALLRTVPLGRVGLSVGALPVVLPVTFRLVGDEVVFSTGPGAKLRAATNHAVVAFEVDHVDAVAHTGWSVLVTGMARLVTDPDEYERLSRSGVPRWLSGAHADLVVLSTDVMSGRRLGHDFLTPA